MALCEQFKIGLRGGLSHDVDLMPSGVNDSRLERPFRGPLTQRFTGVAIMDGITDWLTAKLRAPKAVMKTVASVDHREARFHVKNSHHRLVVL